MDTKIPIGISACLLGQKVRYDGGHKRDRYITDSLGKYFNWLPVCPETEIGLGIPRPTIRLEENELGIRLVQPSNGADLTKKMDKFSLQRVQLLSKGKIYGFILKSKSPSCGMERVKLYRDSSVKSSGRGLFAKVLMEKIPNLPVEEEGRLNNPVLRENWIKRVFVYFNFHAEVFPRPSIGKLVNFHSKQKFLVLSHCPTTYSELGKLVANAKGRDLKLVLQEYELKLMNALKKQATISKNINVLEHLLGFFKNQINALAKKEILSSLSDYRHGYIPLIVPVTLIKHYASLSENLSIFFVKSAPFEG